VELDQARLDISEVARLVGVSSRTLRHYDAIGLVRPAGTDAAGRRWYGRAELLRLQQVLVLRALGMPLEPIAAIVDGRHDELAALSEHRARVAAERDRLADLLDTIDRTIDHLRKEGRMSIEDVFAGLPGYDPDLQRAYETEARERWGDAAVDASRRRTQALAGDAARAHLQEHERIGAALAACAAANQAASSPDVQRLVAEHHAWVSGFWTPDADAYIGLGRMYVDDERFRATYDAFGAGTAVLLRDAIEVYADAVLRV
jgi:DNA-binding transcriptional MerR regulator